MQAYTPEFVLIGIALVLLMADTFFKKLPKEVLGLAGAFGLLCNISYYTEDLYGNIYPILALVATALTLLLAVDFKKIIVESSNDGKSTAGTGEFYILPILACVGITAMCKATNLIALFVALEILTLSSYILVGYFRRNIGSMEAGTKYLILGATSTGIMVFGMAWYFGITGTFDYNSSVIDATLASGFAPALYFALAMMVLGTAFKVGAVPMQLWIPDVYQGAPTPTTAFLSVASKVAGFALLQFILAPFINDCNVNFIIGLMAAATLLVGNLGAIHQTNLKRLLGYSSIAQAGFILPFFITNEQGPNDYAGLYLAAYLVMTFGAFFALAMVRTQRGSEAIDAFAGLGKTNPRLAFAITVMFASLAGVPLTVGFLAKFTSFVYVITSHQYLSWLLPIMIISAASGFYYYLKVVKAMYWDAQPEATSNAKIHVPVISGVVLVICTLTVLLGGTIPLFFM